jgi:hypothetical protein
VLEDGFGGVHARAGGVQEALPDAGVG